MAYVEHPISDIFYCEIIPSVISYLGRKYRGRFAAHSEMVLEVGKGWESCFPNVLLPSPTPGGKHESHLKKRKMRFKGLVAVAWFYAEKLKPIPSLPGCLKAMFC